MSRFPLDIPAALVEHRQASFPDWLMGLSNIIRRCAERWDLRVGPAFPNLSFNYVASAERRHGERVILKLCPPDLEFGAEVDALRLFDGKGMVRLLAVEETWGAMLLERVEPGKAIIELADDEEATGAALEVMQRFWVPPPAEHRFSSLEDWFGRAFARHRDFYGGSGPFEAGLLAHSEKLTEELLETSGEHVVLHGDLNYGNVLSATRASWLGIDPKGVIGDPVFDTAILLHDPTERILAQPDPSRFLARRVDQIVEQTGFARERVVGWGLAYAVLSALWSAEDGASGWEDAYRCAEILATL